MYLFELSVEEERRIDIKNAFIDGNVIGRKEGIKEGEIKGKEQMVVSLHKKGLLSKDVAIAELNVTDKEFEHLLSIY